MMTLDEARAHLGAEVTHPAAQPVHPDELTLSEPVSTDAATR